MNWQEALEIVVARTGHQHFRRNCDDSHANHMAWRSEMIRMAVEPAATEHYHPTPQLPPITRQLASAAGAIIRLGIQFLTGAPLLVSSAELDRRLAKCQLCEFWTGSRCTECGCFGQLKARLESESGQCPKGKWDT